ncbi:MAG: YcxB family protein [Hungatella sp.]|nr:YcxB family protein [Hungatella sp.]
MAKDQEFQFQIQVEAGDLWKFSMYHANKGYLGIFNVLFTLASLYLLITKWGSTGAGYRLLLLMCVLMFSVWQPGLLFLKAAKQAKNERLKVPVTMTFHREGFSVVQGDQSMDVTWDQVGKVAGIKGEYILYMGRIHAYLLPDRAMGEGKEQFAGFLREVLPKERLKRV